MQWFSSGQVELEIESLLSIAKLSKMDVDFKTLFFKRFLVDRRTVVRFHTSSRAEAWTVWSNEDLLEVCRDLRFADEVDVWVGGDRYAVSHPAIQYSDMGAESLMIELWQNPSSGVTDVETGEMLWIHPRCVETLGITWDRVMRCHRHLIKELWKGVDVQRRDKLLERDGRLTDFEFYSYALDGDRVIQKLLIAEEIRLVEIGGKKLRVTKGIKVGCPNQTAIATKDNQGQA